MEFQCHGGRAVVDALLRELGRVEGLRTAQPGEFTRRAFENGRIDLTEAEGLADLIEAETESQRKAALAIAEGGLRAQVEQWQRKVLDLSARAEAAIDYAEDEDVGVDPALARDCGDLASELKAWLERPRIEPLKDGVRVVVAGPPNVGKSSLINYLARRELAIVTDVPGTTRDILTIDIDLDGYVVHFYDTAGLRETEELVEIEGIRRAQKAMQDADLVLWVREAGSDEDNAEFISDLTVPVIAVRSKADLPEVSDVVDASLAISTRTGQGVSELLDAIKGYLPDLARHGGLAVPSRERHREELTACLRSIDEALQKSTDDGLEIAAEHLRQASLALGRLAGQVDIEALLDVIFSEFCVGK